MQLLIAIALAFFISLLPSWLVGWLFGKNIGLVFFAGAFVLISIYFHYFSKKDKSDTLTIVYSDQEQALNFFINKDLIHTAKVTNPNQLTALLEIECQRLEQIIEELVGKIQLINLKPQHLPKQLGNTLLLEE